MGSHKKILLVLKKILYKYTVCGCGRVCVGVCLCAHPNIVKFLFLKMISRSCDISFTIRSKNNQREQFAKLINNNFSTPKKSFFQMFVVKMIL